MVRPASAGVNTNINAVFVIADRGRTTDTRSSAHFADVRKCPTVYAPCAALMLHRVDGEQNGEAHEVLFHGLLSGDADRARTDDLLRDRQAWSFSLFACLRASP